jgi:ribonuclease PH
MALRKDLRDFTQSRTISINIGGVNEVDGACQLSQGKTNVLATVVGPVQPKYSRHELSDRAKLEIEVNFATSSRSSTTQTTNASTIVETLRKAITPALQLELFPRKLIILQILITQNEGSILSTVLNASILAFMDAGLPMFYFFSSLEVAIQSNQLFLDPTIEEELKSEANVLLCMRGMSPEDDEDGSNSPDSQVILMEQIGVTDLATLKNILEISSKYAYSLSRTIRNAIESKIKSNGVY